MEITEHKLQQLLKEAARQGALQAFEDLACYHYQDACKILRISHNTLKRRIMEGKIRPVDGRITGREIRRYLAQHDSD